MNEWQRTGARSATNKKQTEGSFAAKWIPEGGVTRAPADLAVLSRAGGRARDGIVVFKFLTLDGALQVFSSARTDNWNLRSSASVRCPFSLAGVLQACSCQCPSAHCADGHTAKP